MENQLGERVGVSRTVIREAMKVLTAKGVLATARRYGTVINRLDDWNLLDADIVSWHKKGGVQVNLIFRELLQLHSIMLPQSVDAALNRLPVQMNDLSDMAVSVLQSHDAAPEHRLQAESTIWVQILEAPQSSMCRQFKALIYEMIRLKQEFEEQPSRSDAYIVTSSATSARATGTKPTLVVVSFWLAPKVLCRRLCPQSDGFAIWRTRCDRFCPFGSARSGLESTIWRGVRHNLSSSYNLPGGGVQCVSILARR